MLALIAQGLSNQEIADRVFLSPNTVKSYIRSVYLKIGVERRGQAVAWALMNGFKPESLRTVDPALLLRPSGSLASRPQESQRPHRHT